MSRASIYNQLCRLYNKDNPEDPYKIQKVNLEKARGYSKDYYSRNREKVLASKKLKYKKGSITADRSAYARNYYEANKEKCIARSLKWAVENKDKARVIANRWRYENGGALVSANYSKKHAARLRPSILASAKNARDTLNDSYIKSYLKSKLSIQPTKEHIELKRAAINFKRTIKELSK